MPSPATCRIASHRAISRLADVGQPRQVPDHPGVEQHARSGYLVGARAVLPIAAVITVLGMVLGLAARTAGFSPLAAAVMSATTFAGGAQFAAIAVFGDGGTIAAALATAVALNARYAL